MKVSYLFIFSCLAGFGIISCSPARKVSTPTMEIKKETKSEEATTAHTDTFLVNLLAKHGDLFNSVLNNKNNAVQIIYTQIERNENNKPTLTHYFFNVDPNLYYYPASTVKMPIAALALHKINDLAITGLNKYSTMITEAGQAGQTAIYNDPSSEDGRPTIANYIKKIFLVSDNDAFNRLYEFLGQEYINYNLHKMGYTQAQILHRLSLNMTEEQNRYTNPVTFYSAAATPLYAKPLQYNKTVYDQRKTLMGKGYYSGDQLINKPFDFSKKNRLALTDLHSILQSIIFPETVKKAQRFNLTDDDYHFLIKHMSMVPRESGYPQYDTSYHDSYVKLLMFGGKEPMDTSIRIFNKEGDAYGFLTDAAYIVDFKNNIEFMLSATIHCNSDGIYNDDRYDYETVGYPFMKNLGRVIYDYELHRSRKNVPDLSHFKLTYGH